MFDVGFSEVLLIFVIALVVLGPEKLPRLASQVGRWVGRARAMARQFREQLEEEVNLEQARKTYSTPPSPATAESQAAPTPDPNGTHHTEPAATPSGNEEPSTPKPEEFTADTFSHAHPTNEFGANPLTADGAAEPQAAPPEVAMPHAAERPAPAAQVGPDAAASGAATPAGSATNDPQPRSRTEAYARVTAPPAPDESRHS